MDLPKTSHHLPTIRHRGLYFASLTLPAGSKVLLEAMTDVLLRDRPFTPSQARLGELTHRSRETVNRQLAALKRRGLVRIIRRGKKLTNVYRLARWLWGRLTGRPERKRPEWLAQMSLRMQWRFQQRRRTLTPVGALLGGGDG